MVHSLRRTAACFAGLAIALASCTGNSGNNAAPRFTAIPAQSVAGGTTFTFDLETYVSDREDADTALTFSVVSGGGAIAFGTPSGGVTPVEYTNDFDTMGTYDVVIRATDTVGKQTDTTLEVEVTSARLAAVQQNTSGLLLLDIDTNATVQVVSGGNQPTFVGGTSSCCALYQLGTGSTMQLWAYDLATRSSTRIAADKTHVTYVDKTTTGRIVYSTGPSTDTDLWIYNVSTGFTTEISAQDGEQDGNAIVTSADLVFYERGTSGQSDIYYFDPALGTSTAVATASSNEVLRAEADSGAVVFTRIGTGGETDLFWYSIGTGSVEIGSDLGSTEQSQSKTWVGTTSDDMVVFELTATLGIDLYMWNSATGTTRTIASAGDDERFEGITQTDGVVYRLVNSGTDNDLFVYTWTGNASATIAATGDDENYLASLSNGDVVYERTSTGDGSLDLLVYSITGASSATIGSAGADDFTFAAVLSNDNIVYTHDAVTPLLRLYDTGLATSSTIASGDAPTFAGETTGGDFVFEQTNTGNTDVFLWDDSGTTVVTIGNEAGDEAFMSWTLASTVLFTRVTTGETNADLFVWNGTTAVQVTDEDTAGLRYDHDVVGAFGASN